MDFHGESRRQFRRRPIRRAGTFPFAFLPFSSIPPLSFRPARRPAIRWQSHDNQCRVVIGNPISLPNCAPNRFRPRPRSRISFTYRGPTQPPSLFSAILPQCLPTHIVLAHVETHGYECGHISDRHCPGGEFKHLR